MSALSAANDEQLAISIVAKLGDLEKQMAKANGITARAYREMTLASDRATKQMSDDAIRSTANINKALASVGTNVGSFGRASKAMQQVAAKTNDAAKAANNLRGQTGNIAAQFQDIAIQLQGGGSPFTVALQQGTQLGAVLNGAGGVKTAVGAVGAAFMSMLSPVNLVTIGLIAAGGAAVQYFMKKKDADDFAAALKKQPAIISSIKAAWGEAAAGAASYSAESAKVVAAQVAEQRRVLAEGIKSATSTAIDNSADTIGFSDALANIASATANLTGSAGAGAPRGLNELSAAVEKLKDAADDPSAMLAFRDALADIVTMDGVDENTRKLAQSLLETTKDAGDAARALVGLKAAQDQSSASTRILVNETKTFNNLMSRGLYNEAAQHAQTLGQALNAAAEAQKRLNEEQSRFAAERLEGAGSKYEALNDYYQRKAAGLPLSEPPSGEHGLLDLLGQTEGTDRGRGYNETLGYGKFTGGPVSLTTMTLDDVMALQGRMLADPSNTFNSSAVGRYQITRSTLRDLMSQLGLKGTDTFDPAMQDRLANELIRQSGGNVDTLRGRWTSLQGVSDQTIGQAYNQTSLGLGNMDPGLKSQADTYQSIIRSGQEYIALQNAQAAAVGQTAQEASRLRHEQEMLNEAQRANLSLTPEQKQAISDLATSMAEAEQNAADLAKSQNKLNEWNQGIKDATSGALKGFISDLLQGKDATEALSNALSSMADKLLDMALDSIFDGLFNGGGGGGGGDGGGGFLSWLGALFSAKGNAFGPAGVIPFANGGVVDKPTLFKFASGTGVMGEAGPEAIMPLRRDASGRLGVAAHGAGGGGNTSVYSPTVNVAVQSSGNRQADEAMAKRMNAEAKAVLDQHMIEFLHRESRNGGMIKSGKFS
jgi:muramidase (phage lysozyme)